MFTRVVSTALPRSLTFTRFFSEANPCCLKERKSGIYTRTGDKGSSSLYNGERRKKYDDVFHALGNTDELNSFLGFARGFAEKSNNGLAPKLIEIQSRLFDLGAAIATPPHTSESKRIEKTKFPEDNVTVLERWIDELDAKLPPFKTFTIPSSAEGGASLQMCRSICRRAERSVVPLVEREEVDPTVQRYLNRLSDFLYVASRWSVEFDKVEEVPWVPHKKF
ncbi:ATP cobalamin adenosyltransferase [Blastocystis sp. subtype 4]|uniref:ATP cobalamin adenosyltransferase n=1 Tax=Blastocystis sp. subtype 4 TaxID=944170 RepID=UPI000712261A|nr:ATP cobalamin adenosyltransferase [Blastocystis sp. subtype 4]KNB46372.1 ATP cobalamin adenosyltransferase [Blastocystis sp. subtype 4]|eukprot:XP_014529815.1 ATP cobalamin adenosyltransferase [Blastocystis sp. subtype 4]